MREGKMRYAVLGLLARHPMSGYDMKRTIAASLGHFWGEGYGQIYPILRTLAEEGLVTRSVEPQERRPDRHIYTITEEGLAVFRRWLAVPPDPARFRIEALMKLFYAQHGSTADSIAHVRQLRAEQQALYELYTALEGEIPERYPDEPGVPFWMITLRSGIRVTQALVEWCDEAEAALTEQAVRQGQG